MMAASGKVVGHLQYGVHYSVHRGRERLGYQNHAHASTITAWCDTTLCVTRLPDEFLLKRGGWSSLRPQPRAHLGIT